MTENKTQKLAEIERRKQKLMEMWKERDQLREADYERWEREADLFLEKAQKILEG